MRRGHQAHDLRLQFVSVLILVHHDVAVLVGELRAQFLALFERVAQTHEQVIVSQQVTRALILVKRFEQFFEVFLLVSELRIMLGSSTSSIESSLFATMLKIAAIVRLRGKRRSLVESPIWRRTSRSGLRCRSGIKHRECARDPRKLRVPSQGRVSHGMKSAAGNALAPLVGKRSGARKHA